MTTLYSELHRPRFHFSAKEKWINDPNGLVYQDGLWHLFFQHNPESSIWGPQMTWGHAVSEDLLHWRQLDHALHPDELGTMFSGSAVIDHENTAGFGPGTMLVFYTAAGALVEPRKPYTQCLAYSNDNGKTLVKFDGNPIVDWIAGDNRDPKVIWHPDTQHWIMSLYLEKDRYCLLKSPDAKSWTLLQELNLEGVSECPDFFPLTDEDGQERWVFWGARGIYRLGQFDGEQFRVETETLVCESGPNGYAAQTWSNTPDDRCIQISWMSGGLYPEMPFSQQLSTPVVLSLAGSGDDARIRRWPLEEISTLRQSSIKLEPHTVSPKSPLNVESDAKLFDISFSLHGVTTSRLYVTVRGQPMVFDWSEQTLSFSSSGYHKIMPDRESLPLPDDRELRIRLLVDRTSVELFINGGLISASYCFLPGAYLHPVSLQCWNGEVTVSDFQLHELKSVWEPTGSA